MKVDLRKSKLVSSMSILYEGYHTIITQLLRITALYSKKDASELQSIKNTCELLFNIFTGDKDIYKLIIGTKAHEEHTGVLIELKALIDNIAETNSDTLNRISQAQREIAKEYHSLKELLLATVESL